MEIEVSIEKPMSEEERKYDEWKVKCAADCLLEAEMYKQDPKMMQLVKEHIAKKKKAILSVDGLRAKAAEMDAEDSEDEED